MGDVRAWWEAEGKGLMRKVLAAMAVVVAEYLVGAFTTDSI